LLAEITAYTQDARIMLTQSTALFIVLSKCT
jgi:hypothetical protein